MKHLKNALGFSAQSNSLILRSGSAARSPTIAPRSKNAQNKKDVGGEPPKAGGVHAREKVMLNPPKL
jgi:hypothetical protein